MQAHYVSDCCSGLEAAVKPLHPGAALLISNSKQLRADAVLPTANRLNCISLPCSLVGEQELTMLPMPLELQ